jgi:hypothetical protein
MKILIRLPCFIFKALLRLQNEKQLQFLKLMIMRIYSVIIIILTSIPIILTGQKVEPLGSGLTLRGAIHDIAYDKEKEETFVVGYFSAIDGVKMESVGIFKNGEWDSIPDSSEIEGVVYSAEVHEGSLYIAGDFKISSDTNICNVAKLENGVWRSLNVEPMYTTIRDLCWFEDELYVTGDFKSINGVTNNGVMKYSKGQWKDSGLNSFLNAEGLFVSGDTLFAWGRGFYGHGSYSHTVSFYTNDRWTTLPGIGSEPTISEACIKYDGLIYAIIHNGLFRFNFDNNEWVLVESLPSAYNSPILFEHENELLLATEKFKIFRLSNGILEEFEIQGLDNNFSGTVNSISSHNDQILVGGDFQHWDSKSSSLSLILNNTISSYGKVSSDITNSHSSGYSVAQSIVRYNGKYLIGGRFSYANNIYSPGLVYWDGEKFSAFELPLPDGVRQLEIFENELYALPHGEKWSDPDLAPYTLIKYDGSEWEGIATPLKLTSFDIINDKLFIKRDVEYSSDDGGPFYLQDGNWQELNPIPVNNPLQKYRYRSISPYKGGYLMKVTRWPVVQLAYLPNDTSEWEVLDTVDVYFDNIIVHDEDIYLTSIWRPQFVFKYHRDRVDTIAQDVETELAHIFNIGDRVYYSAWNEGLYRVNNSLEYYNSLGIRDIEEVDEGRYLLALQRGLVNSGLDRDPLNKIALLSFETLAIDVNQDYQEICTKEYVQYWPITDHVNVKYSWEFEGGIPSHSNSSYPMIKYDSTGTYIARVEASNLDGDTVYRTAEVKVADCKSPSPRANNYDNHWIMGNEYYDSYGLGGFDFTFPDTILSPRYLSPGELEEGNIVMSDINGNLQFHSNGRSIWNMHNEAIEGSECFNSDLDDYHLDAFISNQSLLSLPDVKEKYLYHIFDLDPINIEGEFWLAGANLSISTIDMSKNNGRGEIVACNEVIIDDILLNSTMQASRHENGKDWWIIVGKYQSDEYYKILFTENGVESIETSSWNRYYPALFSGQSTFSPNGKFYAQIIKENQEVSIWRFDNATGDLYDQKLYTIATVDNIEYPYGCSFSPNSRFLYISSLTQLRQIDLCNYENLEVELIDSWDGSYEFVYPLYFGKQMLSPNQKVIIASYGNGHTAFGVIERPNEKGKECDFNQHSLRISDFTSNFGDIIPIFPHFRNYSSYTGDCGSVHTVEYDLEHNFFAYPNPISSQTTLYFNQKTSGQLYSVNGALIYSFANTDYLDINSLPSGTYFLRTHKWTTKIIKQ